MNAQGIISTVAGSLDLGSGYSGDGGPGTSAQLGQAIGLALDQAGNLYIADEVNSCIRKLDTSGIITTVAGNTTPGYSGDGGPAVNAELNSPFGLVVDSFGNLYIADTSNNRVRVVNTAGIFDCRGYRNCRIRWGRRAPTSG